MVESMRWRTLTSGIQRNTVAELAEIQMPLVWVPDFVLLLLPMMVSPRRLASKSRPCLQVREFLGACTLAPSAVLLDVEIAPRIAGRSKVSRAVIFAVSPVPFHRQADSWNR